MALVKLSRISRIRSPSPSALKQSLMAAKKLSEANLTASVGLPLTLELQEQEKTEDQALEEGRKGEGGYFVISEIERSNPPTISRGCDMKS
jgi:hypothetical protein